MSAPPGGSLAAAEPSPTPAQATPSTPSISPLSSPDDVLPEYTKRRALPPYSPPETPAHNRTTSGRARRAASWVSAGIGKLAGVYLRGGYPLHNAGDTPAHLRPRGHGVEVARARIRERDEMERAAAAAAHRRAVEAAALAGDVVPPEPHAISHPSAGVPTPGAP